jgi:TRAP-type C4-dicarboxylate transport system substrate-binding protein
MEKKLLLSLLVLALVAVPLFAACAEEAPPEAPPEAPTEAPPEAPTEVIELTVATTTPPTASPSAAVTAWAEKFEEASGGRVEFTIYYSSSLFEAKEILRSVQAGVADISDFWLDAVPGTMPLNLVTELPFLGWPDPATATIIYRELFNMIPELEAEYEGVKVLYPTMSGELTSYVHTNSKLVKSAADLKGLKIGGGGNTARWLDAMGAIPVFVPFEDTYMSLDRGLIEGHTGTFGWQEGAGCVELTPYHTVIGATLSHVYNPLIMNPDSWDRLPPDIQQIFDDLDSFYTDLRIGFEMESETNELRITKEELGHTYFTLPPEETKLWIDAGKPIHEKWLADTEAQGLPATEVYEEIQRLIAEYSK